MNPQVCRQWVYYRLMEHGVLLDFKNRDSKTENDFKKSKMLWVLIVGAITTIVQFGNDQIQKFYYADWNMQKGSAFATLAVS